MKFMALFFAVFLAGALAPVTACADEVSIATIAEVEGNVTRTRSGGTPEPLDYQSPVFKDDVIKVGKASRAMIIFVDDTQLVLSENAELRIDRYVYDPDQEADNAAEYSVLHGAFLYVSGLIAKKNPQSIMVNTSHGSIGIRGTEFWGGDIDGKFGVLVSKGAVNFRNMAGGVDIREGEGSTVEAIGKMPGMAKRWQQEKIDRAVKTVTFLHAARAEQRRRMTSERNVQKREEIRKRMQQIREQRQGATPQRQQDLRNRLEQRQEQRLQKMDRPQRQLQRRAN